MTIITDDSILTNLDYQVNRYIEICTLFYSLFSLSRTPCGDIDHKIKRSGRSNIFMFDKMENSTIIDENDKDTPQNRTKKKRRGQKRTKQNRKEHNRTKRN